MDKTYNPHAIEKRWYDSWEENQFFSPSGTGDPYCIVIPPPNVTGTLHMGHAFQDTIMDMLIRYHRMAGKNTLWQPGTDHAGIATQMVVERQLARENTTRHELGREKFLQRVWQWKEESGGTITQQLRRMGASLDWTRERFTMDEGMSDAVEEVFIRLYDEGIIYRGKRLVNWDPVLHTALSDLEVLSEEENGHLWHLRYPIEGSDQYLVVATTRPETMLGDTAVAVHPDDERYKHLIGQVINLPLVGRAIAIIGDEYVDPEFGSGCVKITPAHDFNDYQVGKRHGLEVINIFDDSAAINDNAPEAYRGMDRFAARKQIVEDFESLGLLDRIDPHKLMVPRGDRSNAVVEPYLTDQWYVDLTSDTTPDGKPGGRQRITQPSIDAVRDGRIEFVPSNWDKTYFQWLNNIEDWCISRQIWWGHRIPAWYDKQGKVYVAATAELAREKYKLAADIELQQDEDVLDTWFSSALWPFSTLGWPKSTDALKTWYPGAVLVTGFDIIFFWVARMIMFGTTFMDGEVPFKQVYMHGLVRDASGQKMSKSKGNVLDPLDIIDGITLEDLLEKRTANMMQNHLADKIRQQTAQEFPDGIPALGTDALRFTFASLATNGRDIRFDLKRVEGYGNFCNKLFNATRYVLMQTEETEIPKGIAADQLGMHDRWIQSRLQQTILAVNDAFTQYRFDLAATALYEFIWNEYCDWYLEMCKPTLLGDSSKQAKDATRATLLSVLETTLRLVHPVMPFISEELWQKVAPLCHIEGQSIMLQPLPTSAEDLVDAQALEEMQWVQTFVTGVRKIRSEQDIAPKHKLKVLIAQASSDDSRRLEDYRELIRSLARIDTITPLLAGDERPESAIALVDEMQVLIPLAGLIDKEAELARLDKELKRLDAEVQRLSSKLDNQGFLAKAPEAVVDKEREKLNDASSAREQLLAQRDKIAKL